MFISKLLYTCVFEHLYLYMDTYMSFNCCYQLNFHYRLLVTVIYPNIDYCYCLKSWVDWNVLSVTFVKLEDHIETAICLALRCFIRAGIAGWAGEPPDHTYCIYMYQNFAFMAHLHFIYVIYFLFLFFFTFCNNTSVQILLIDAYLRFI